MDPLSDVLSLLKPRNYASGGFDVARGLAIRFPEHQGIKCYAVVSGECRLSVDGVAEGSLLTEGDCFLLPSGRPFCLASDPASTAVDFHVFVEELQNGSAASREDSGGCSLVGGYFVLAGRHAEILLGSLAPIVHLRKDSDKAALRWSLERMKEELRDPRPGGTLITQQLAYLLLVQALRLHLADGPAGSVGWLFALADTEMGAAIQCMHADPAHHWTLRELAERVGMSRSIFASRFKQTVGTTPISYLTHWRMLLAGDRLNNARESISAIALSLGYESESAFGKAFTRVMGCSPRQYGRGKTMNSSIEK